MLVVVWGCSCANATTHNMTINDSVGGSGGQAGWVLPASHPNTNPPNQASSGGVTASNFDYGYIRNSSSVTWVETVETGASPNNPQGFSLTEWSGIDNNIAPLGDNLQVPAPSLVTDPNAGASLSLTTCDSPTTDELMGQGKWFCSHPDAYLVITSLYVGKETYGAPTNSYNALTTVTMNGANSNDMAVAYKIISASGSTNTTWTESITAKPGASGIMAFPQDSYSGTDRRQSLFWAK
jgi:hypothetical protein